MSRLIDRALLLRELDRVASRARRINKDETVRDKLNKLMADVLTAVNAAEPVDTYDDGWINPYRACSRDNTSVLCVVTGGDQYFRAWMLATYSDEYGYILDDDGTPDDMVVHWWHPLPDDPPEDEV